MVMKDATNIEKWADWPADVRDELRTLNRQRRLSFRGEQAFECTYCGDTCRGQRYGNAILDGAPWCDHCLIRHTRWPHGGASW